MLFVAARLTLRASPAVTCCAAQALLADPLVGFDSLSRDHVLRYFQD